MISEIVKCVACDRINYIYKEIEKRNSKTKMKNGLTSNISFAIIKFNFANCEIEIIGAIDYECRSCYI